MKYPKNSSQILHEVAKKKLSGHDFRVFMDWLADKKGFNPTAQVIADRIGSSRSQVAKSLTRLRDSNVLKDNGFIKISSGQPTNKYDLHDDIKKAAGITSSKKINPKNNTLSKATSTNADLNAQKAGFADAEQQKEYLERYEVLTPEKIEKIQKRWKELDNDPNVDIGLDSQ